MKICLLTAVILAATAVPAFAQDEDAGNIIRLFYFEVKTGHGDEFGSGFDAYWECYRENGGQQSWTAWNPATGKLGAVMFRSRGHNWADFDEEDAAGIACDEVFESSVVPHFDDFYGGFRRTLPDVSRGTDGPVDLVLAYDFDVSDNGAAREVIAAWHEAFVAADSGKYVWTRHETSIKGWDFSLALLNENFADLAPGDRSFGEIQRAHHGEEKAAELAAKWRENVKQSRSRMFRRNKNLSYQAE